MPPKLGIIAGGGQLPETIVQQCEQAGRPCFIVALSGQAEPDAFANAPHAWVRLGAAGEAVRQLKVNGVEELILAGSVRKPSITDLRPDAWATKFLATTGAFQRGDDSLLRALIRHLETAEGLRVVGIADVAPGLLAREGVLTERSPEDADHAAIEAGFIAAKNLGRRDLGQAVVATATEIVAEEDRAGTDAMLRNLGDGQGGILVKALKPAQERRADLPTIGPETLILAAERGLKGIVIEAGGALLLNRDEMVRIADRHNLFIAGLPAPAGSDDVIPEICLIAGEPSADALGGRLMSALRSETNDKIMFSGIGGPAMENEGLISLFPMTDLAVMGLAEVLPRIPALKRRISETVKHIEAQRPAAVVGIDSPDFNFRVAKRLKGKGIPLIHFVAPSVWAWRPGRARKIAKFLDHLLALLPFEPPYFEKEGLPTTYVGHPILECGASPAAGVEFRARHGIGTEDKVLMMLPGSRQGEARRLLPAFIETVAILAARFPGLRVFTVTATPTHELLTEAANNWTVPVTLVTDPAEKYAAFAAADVALAASGTVAVELAMTETPSVIAYKVNPLTAWIAQFLIKVRFANLINIVLDRPAIPEFIAADCRAELMAPALADLLENPARAQAQKDAYGEALRNMGQGEGAVPSQRAAAAILAVINAKENGAG